ncbi:MULTISPECIES: hypothetical protein [Helicobacter]|uniref:Uncharacterized protein n=1 Tax=Helicobacter bilis ATCC 43879 TaxID=613026 RepID=C3XHH0_9HELI|nr:MULTISPECIES: hypothetical protein [Helicobacter]EEO24459.2 hypothetical protein HRAG_01516 [Helicobacter bilis ATCC 43879]
MFKYCIVFISIICSLYGNDVEMVHKDCKILCKKCGFYARQTEGYFEKLKISNDNEDDFYTAMDDWAHYLYSARDYLRANGIKTNFYAVDVKECGILIFQNYSLEINKIDTPYIFILYQKGKKPYKLMDISAPEDEINTYFNITKPKYPKESE